MIRATPWLAALTVLTAVVACSGAKSMIPCDTPTRPADITAKELVGTYQGTDGKTVTLRADGTATVNSDTGTWTLSPPGSQPWAPDIPLGVSFARDPKDTTFFTPSNLLIGGTREHPIIWYYNGDVDSCDVRKLTRTDPSP